jgi:hypothetical protein
MNDWIGCLVVCFFRCWCAVFVVGNNERRQVLLYQEQSSATDSSQQITGALVTGAVVLVGVLIATTAFICLYKYRCLKVLFVVQQRLLLCFHNKNFTYDRLQTY